MTKILAGPRVPSENWQQNLADWITEVGALINQAQKWAETRGWATRQDQKIITEEIFGTYEAPALLIHTPGGRLLLDPVARNTVGAEGRLDFCVMPSYDSVALVKVDGGWTFLPDAQNGLRLPWTEEAFEKLALELLNRQ
jgi:hypothetical protein